MPIYRLKRENVEAIQLTPQNGARLAEWCYGEWKYLPGKGDHYEDLSHIVLPEDGGCVMLGEWLVREESGQFVKIVPEFFDEHYEMVTNVPLAGAEMRYREPAHIMYEALKQISNSSQTQPDGYSQRRIALVAIQSIAEIQLK